MIVVYFDLFVSRFSFPSSEVSLILGIDGILREIEVDVSFVVLKDFIPILSYLVPSSKVSPIIVDTIDMPLVYSELGYGYTIN